MDQAKKTRPMKKWLNKIIVLGALVWIWNLLHRQKVKTWYGIFLVSFFAIITSLLLWAASGDLLTLSQAATSAKNPGNFCADSDYQAKNKGNDYYKKGTVTYRTYGYGYKKTGQEIKYTDKCETSARLREYFCANKAVKNFVYYCPHGCANGACKPAPVVKCVDPDARSKDPYAVKSTVSLYNNNKISKIAADACDRGDRSQRTLVEYICKNNGISSVKKVCAYRCNNGVCVNKK